MAGLADSKVVKTTYCAYFDRTVGQLEGKFTLQQVNHWSDGRVTSTKLFSQLPATSGQSAYTKTSWTIGKSPIPFSEEVGPLYLWTTMIHRGERHPGPGQTGEYFHISNSRNDWTKIFKKVTGQLRTYIGLHRDQKDPKYKGTAGCIGLIVYTEGQEITVESLFRELDYLNSIGIKDIPLVVL